MSNIDLFNYACENASQVQGSYSKQWFFIATDYVGEEIGSTIIIYNKEKYSAMPSLP